MNRWDLPAHHRRALTIGLRLVYEALQDLRSALAEEPRTDLFTVYDDPIPPTARPVLERIADEIEKCLAELAQTFGLPRFRQSIRQRTASRIANAWVTAAECGSRHLRGYGYLPPDVAAYLDARVEFLAARLMELEQSLQASDVRRDAGSSPSEGQAC
jgi:hypothetical protein